MLETILLASTPSGKRSSEIIGKYYFINKDTELLNIYEAEGSRLALTVGEAASSTA